MGYMHLSQTQGKMHSLKNAHLEQNCKLHKLYELLHPMQVHSRHASICRSSGNYVHSQYAHCLEDNKGN